MFIRFWHKVLMAVCGTLIPFSAAAQSYEEVQRKARETNAQREVQQAAERASGSRLWCSNVKTYLPQARQERSEFVERFPDLDRRARQTMRLFYNANGDRLTVANNSRSLSVYFEDSGHRVTEINAPNARSTIFELLEVEKLNTSTTRADFANNAIVERYVASYTLAMRGYSGAIERQHLEDGNTAWGDVGGWRESCWIGGQQLSRQWKLVVVSVAVRADDRVFVDVCLPYHQGGSCDNYHGPDSQNPAPRDLPPSLKRFANYIEFGWESFAFGGLSCPQGSDFARDECNLRATLNDTSEATAEGQEMQRLSYSYYSPDTPPDHKPRIEQIVRSHRSVGGIDWAAAATEYFPWREQNLAEIAEIAEAKARAAELKRGFLGAMVAVVDSDIAKSLGLTSSRGALIQSVMPGQSAEKACLRPGDVVLTANGEEVTPDNTLPQIVSNIPFGTHMPLSYMRNGEMNRVTTYLGRRDSQLVTQETEANLISELLGISVGDLSNHIYIDTIDCDSDAPRLGLAFGMAIRSANYRRISSEDDLEAALIDVLRHPYRQNIRLELITSEGAISVNVPLRIDRVDRCRYTSLGDCSGGWRR